MKFSFSTKGWHDSTFEDFCDIAQELHFEGTWNSSYAANANDWRDAMSAVAEGKISLKPLITHHVALKDALSAIQMMNDRTEFYCKVMIDNER